jgi:hypothetical protein
MPLKLVYEGPYLKILTLPLAAGAFKCHQHPGSSMKETE